MIDVKPDWARIDHVLLDMDGTVLDLAFDTYFWSELVPQRYAARLGIPLEQARFELEPKFRAVQHTLPWYCMDYWSSETGLDLAAMKREVCSRIAPLAGAIDFLDAVRAAGRHLWLVTNAHRDSWTLKLDHTGLASRFDRILSSHEFGVPKEHPSFWDRLRAQAAFEPARALFVDDSLPVLHTARAYGIGQVIGIRCPDSGGKPRVIEGIAAIDGLHALLPIDRHAAPATPG
jgi:putative hydrolase of the HAD superfamily